MTFPSLTAAYAAIFGLLFTAISLRITYLRFRLGIHHGDGDAKGLARWIRAHANFAEYVPLILILAALHEAAGAPPAHINVLMLMLLVARIAHPFGMLAKVASPAQYLLRGTSAVSTWTVLAAVSLLLLIPR